MLSDLLRAQGCDTATAYSGRDALDVFPELLPQLVILDVGLPDISGLEVARQLRASPLGASTPLIALTGWGQDADRERTAAAGFNLHRVKPVEPEALLQDIVALLRQEATP